MNTPMCHDNNTGIFVRQAAFMKIVQGIIIRMTYVLLPVFQKHRDREQQKVTLVGSFPGQRIGPRRRCLKGDQRPPCSKIPRRQ